MQIPELPFATPKALEGRKRWKIIAISTEKSERQSSESQSRENQHIQLLWRKTI
jgi:hypothetical protein